LFDHPPYSPDLTPSDYDLFTYLKNWLGSQPFNSNEGFMEGSSQAAGFFDKGMQKLIPNISASLPVMTVEKLLKYVQWYLGIRSLWNKSNLVYVLFGRETFCLVYDLCLEYNSRAKTFMSQNES
jgi:hypothetical protein